MADSWGTPRRRHDPVADDRLLPPVLLPFTVLASGASTAAPETERSLGHRMGLWWEDAGGAEGGVMVTGLQPGGPAAASRSVAVGDLIVEVDGYPVQTLGDLVRYVGPMGSGSVQLTLRSASGGSPGQAALQLPPARRASDASTAPATAARVPTTDLIGSIRGHIERILCNPLQSEVTHPGVAADPDFGCLGADLEFSIEGVGLSEMRNAIAKCEPRLKEIEVSPHDIEVREAGETRLRPGIHVEAKLAATGAPVQVDLEILQLARNRNSNRLRRRMRSGEAPTT